MTDERIDITDCKDQGCVRCRTSYVPIEMMSPGHDDVLKKMYKIVASKSLAVQCRLSVVLLALTKTPFLSLQTDWFR